jgi:hypothetical protein
MDAACEYVVSVTAAAAAGGGGGGAAGGGGGSVLVTVALLAGDRHAFARLVDLVRNDVLRTSRRWRRLALRASGGAGEGSGGDGSKSGGGGGGAPHSGPRSVVAGGEPAPASRDDDR